MQSEGISTAAALILFPIAREETLHTTLAGMLSIGQRNSALRITLFKNPPLLSPGEDSVPKNLIGTFTSCHSFERKSKSK